jgi:hypothetical protein
MRGRDFHEQNVDGEGRPTRPSPLALLSAGGRERLADDLVFLAP